MRANLGLFLLGSIGLLLFANRTARADEPKTPAPAAPPAPAATSPAAPATAPSAPASTDAGKSADIGSLSLDSMLKSEVNASTFGSAAYRLPKQGFSVYIHGTANLGVVGQDVKDPDGLREVGGHPWTFARMGFNLFAGAAINDVVFVESEMEAAPRGDADDPMSIRYAQLDVRVLGDYLLVRVGEFFTPIGGLNVYPDPDYLHKFPETPLFYRHVVPQDWSEVGVQIFGRVPFGDLFGTYALYAVNGLEQPADSVGAGGATGQGGALDELAFNHLDLNSRAKSLGGRIGVESNNGFGLGISGYSGIYTADGRHALHIGDIDASARFGQLNLKAEGAYTVQEIDGGNLTKWGYYALASYELLPEFEPMVRVDGIKIEGSPQFDRTQLGIGFIVRPYPEKASTLMLKTAYFADWDGDGHFFANRISSLLAVAF